MANVDDKFRELAAAVQNAGGLLVCTMERLRDVYEAGRLGPHVRAGISDKLAQHGLGHLPEELPSYQHEEVRVYGRGTRTGKLIEAVLKPSARGDELLVDSADADANETLQRIRALVCDTQ